MQRPNILFILADDMGAWALGCAGNPEVRTPNLDRIAASGLRLENAYCVSPVCSPARASLLTGKIPSQHGVHDWIRRGNAPSESSDGAVIDYLEGQATYTEILERNGYYCGLSGKWHLGNAPQVQKGHSFWRVHARGGGPYYDAPMIREGEEYVEARYVTDVITEHALDFLAEQQGQESPFYLGVHYTAPHSPWGRDQHPAEFFDPYYNDCPFDSVPDLPMHPWQINTAPYGITPESRRELLSGYYASITAMDAGIGRLLDALEAQGILEDTLIVFTGDNGMNMGHHGIYGKGNGTYPQNMFDTSVKVPFLIAHPGSMPSGVVSDALFSHYDFMPSLLDYLGLEAEIPQQLPGKVQSRLWTGGATSVDAPLVVFDEYGPARMIRSQDWKYVRRFTEHSDELYDLSQDPDESCNLMDAPEYAERVNSMREQLDAWFARYVEAGCDGAELGITGRGQLDHARKKDVFASDWHYLKERSVASILEES
ncbi:sulfatase-like hydrolase/transferase [Coraliomargarita algicola]|uniref:Sulfatase-like hydrolase/transferase n=1 Tax=Coraliomargarita algicola TaxID=3092156 RepID=A0ABZ0RGA0_9BACT|nr:sulfatase-like hydrolase/transferase [Coraliomargarita sp. J2-16]WPJ95189.1 sulfatase-like hydrolase/transferase [Coraliomargarita sp. J2-16]